MSNDLLGQRAKDIFARFRVVGAEHSRRLGNEADTRRKVIDFVLREILAWPDNMVSVEEYISPGFADFVLKKQNGDAALFVEAKREGIYFELPHAHKNGELSAYMPAPIKISASRLLSRYLTSSDALRSYQCGKNDSSIPKYMACLTHSRTPDFTLAPPNPLKCFASAWTTRKLC